MQSTYLCNSESHGIEVFKELNKERPEKYILVSTLQKVRYHVPLHLVSYAFHCLFVYCLVYHNKEILLFGDINRKKDKSC